jgi:hypothetical protein
MRVLFRAAITWVVAIPMLLALVVVFMLAGRRAPVSQEGGDSGSLERGNSLGPPVSSGESTAQVAR